MSSIGRIFKSFRVLLALALLIISLIAIAPNPWIEGVAITSVDPGSAADIAGMGGAAPSEAPTSRERITNINNMPIKSAEDYYELIQLLEPNQTISITTNKAHYRLTTQPEVKVTVLPELEEITIQEVVPLNITVNGTVVESNDTVNRTLTVNKTISEVVGMKDLGIRIAKAATTNIRKGLDLQGGTRVLLKPEGNISPESYSVDDIIQGMRYRLDVFGLKDIVVRTADDLSGNRYILVEVAGVNEEEVKELIQSEGKFEAKVGETLLFSGGDDIVDVCKSGTCSGLDPDRGCGQTAEGWFCGFRFAVTLSQEAADRQYAAIKDLGKDPTGSYVSKQLDLYLDDVLVDSLNIGAEFLEAPVTSARITGTESGATRDLAMDSAVSEMSRLQTILITGKLPVKLEAVRTDSISPVFGERFIKNAFLIAIVAVVVIAGVLMFIYRKLKIAIPMMLTSLSEIVMMLGIASLIGWNIDLAAIAGIIAAVGTGVNDQIIITDEALRGELRRVYSWKAKIKSAFFIIMGAYFTTAVAMIPLFFAGAGLLRGFAVITLIGITLGVFITRPAYAKIVEILVKE
ncbi:hypothetical protein JXB11_04730 [Candidatus Woesearchaeota archaeon]|nr:hypothetical protein [Candidatus Woesearchaeota archaeon]